MNPNKVYSSYSKLVRSTITEYNEGSCILVFNDICVLDSDELLP